MNMFKRGRKAKEQNNDTWDALNRPQSPQSLFKHSRTMKRKNKNYVEEDKPAFDLDSVLPDTDDFRTSLLMPGLSARFSMLREQDDPNSKIGKASDDSVLFPKRASRMNLFNHHNPLTDIAEVESIRSSFKPPFADRERANSFGDGYDSDGGSIMGRSRPGEGKGNVLFGGRQKLYRIPTGCAKGPESGGPGLMTGKHVYEDDVSLSTFQQYRTKQYDPRGLGDEPKQSPTTEPEESASAHTSSVAFSKNRGTQSSTNSGSSNLRTSTAATSVISDSPATRNSSSAGTTASYKLTNETPNTSVDSFGQAASPGLRRLRDESALLAREPSKSKSAINMRDKFQRSGAVYTAADIRSPSPPLSAGPTQPLDFGFGDNNNTSVPLARRRVESPTLKRDNDVLASSVQPNDRGKATALGLFNKPTKEFDEQQYLERQLQMHEGRNSPFSTTSRSASRISTEARPDSKNEEASNISPAAITGDRVSTPQLPPIPTATPSPVPGSNRASRASNSSGGRRTPPSRPRSKSSASATAKDNVKARVESLIRRQNAELAALEAEKLGTSEREDKPKVSVQDKEMFHNTFDDNDSSDEGDQEVTAVIVSVADKTRLPNGEIHPAFRSEVSLGQASDQSSVSQVRSNMDDRQAESDIASTNTSETNSSPLTAQLGLGLSGMIRTHLRQDSDKSTIMPPPSPTPIPIPDRSQERQSMITANTVSENTPNSNSNVSTSHLTSGEPTVDRAPSPNTVMSRKAAEMLDRAMAIRIAAAQSKAQRIVADDIEEATNRAPHDDNEPSHRRVESSETFKERREFDEELAERRRRILERVNERDRSTSPTVPSRGRDLTMQAFAQSGDDHIDNIRDQPTKPFDNEPISQRSRPGLESRTSDEHRGRKMSLRDQQSNSPPGAGHARVRPMLPQSHFSPQDGYGDVSSAPTGMSSSSRYARARSNSAAPERSKSRPRYVVEPNLPIPGAYPSSQPTSPMPSHQHHNPPTEYIGYQRSNSVANSRNGFRTASSPLPDNVVAYSPQPSPMLPMSPRSQYTSLAEQGRQASYGSGRTTPTSNGRATPLGNRKRSGTKTQISEPTFISSTSSVPLVPLPTQGSPEAPPLPEMNPRRRGSGTGERSHPVLDLSNLARTPLETVPASPRFPDMETMRDAAQSSAQPSRLRARLRKSSSEGGNLAAKARQQALMMELAREKDRSPAVPVFPNRSTTSLGLRTEGGMF